MSRRSDSGRLKAAWALAAAAVLMATSVSSAALAEDAPGSQDKYDFYGDPKVPDISGLWLGSYESVPGEVPQINFEQKNIVRWYPWPWQLTPEYKKKSDERIAAAKLGHSLGDASARCLPFGMPRAITGRAYPDEITETPGVVIVWSFGTYPIFIWTDGRGHPKDLKPSYNGHTIGYWIGDTLYADTVGLVANTVVDQSRQVVHSDKMHMTATYQRVRPDVIHVHVTLDDPEAFTEPLVTTNIWRRQYGHNWEMLDDISCFENNNNPTDDKGEVGFSKF